MGCGLISGWCERLQQAVHRPCPRCRRPTWPQPAHHTCQVQSPPVTPSPLDVNPKNFCDVNQPTGHYLLGLKILHQLVLEMNTPTPGRTLTQHRKVAVSFRDLCLLKVRSRWRREAACVWGGAGRLPLCVGRADCLCVWGA